MGETLYELTRSDGTTSGGYRWSMPTDDGPGEWHEVTGPLVHFQNGLHVLREQNLSEWLNQCGVGALLWECEADGKIIEEPDKLVARRVRLTRLVGVLDERRLRLLACTFAERVLPLFEAEFPDDKRPREAIEVARRFANGDATKDELAAAYAAAWGAARAAARDAYAASAAARAAAWAAASAAARAAARDAYAASAAALAAARAAERAWQGAEILRQLGATDAS